MFSKVDRYSEYLTVYNLFTPLDQRRCGYAHTLLGLIIDRAQKHHVKRITFSSVSDSLDFYLALGFVFWGVNGIGDYHCDLPIPIQGLEGLKTMIETCTLEALIGGNIEKIYGKVYGNSLQLTPKQLIRYERDQVKLSSKCDFELLLSLRRMKI